MNTDINKPKTENLAGIISLKFADILNVKSVENGVLELKPNYSLKKIDTIQGKWNFEGDFLSESDGGYDFKLSGIISGHDKNLLTNTIMASVSDLVLVVQLNNISYLAGNLDEGIHFKFSHFSGSKPGEETGYKLDFYRKLRRPVIVLNSVI